MLKVKEYIEKEELISKFAKEMARLQKKSDKYYYIDKDYEMADYVCNQISYLKDFSIKLGICKEMFIQAYKIYDFRNSGKADFKPSEEQLEELRNFYDTPTDDF